MVYYDLIFKRHGTQKTFLNKTIKNSNCIKINNVQNSDPIKNVKN